VNWDQRIGQGYWFDLASSSDGTKLVAVVYGGHVYTSTDSGVNWIERVGSVDWYAVASSSDGTKLVVVIDGGQIYTSTDSGVNWAQRTVCLCARWQQRLLQWSRCTAQNVPPLLCKSLGPSQQSPHF